MAGAKARLRRLVALERKFKDEFLGPYLFVAFEAPDGVTHYRDGMRGEWCDESVVNKRCEQGYQVFIRYFQWEFHLIEDHLSEERPGFPKCPIPLPKENANES